MSASDHARLSNKSSQLFHEDRRNCSDHMEEEDLEGGRG